MYEFGCSIGYSGSLYLDYFEIIFFILPTVVPDFITIFKNGSNERAVYSFEGFAWKYNILHLE